MLLRRAPKENDEWFAWRPVWTDAGLVWLEWVLWEWHDIEFGSYTYKRKTVYDDRSYDLGATTPYATYASSDKPRWDCPGQSRSPVALGRPWSELLRDISSGDMTFSTPPDPAKNCRMFNPDGPTPCWYPHCDCLDPETSHG